MASASARDEAALEERASFLRLVELRSSVSRRLLRLHRRWMIPRHDDHVGGSPPFDAASLQFVPYGGCLYSTQ